MSGGGPDNRAIAAMNNSVPIIATPHNAAAAGLTTDPIRGSSRLGGPFGSDSRILKNMMLLIDA